MSSNYYLGLMKEAEKRQEEINEDIKNYTSLKNSANSCIPQIESIIKTFKNVAACLQYVCPVGKPFDNGQCLANAKKLEEVVSQLTLLVEECTTELMILEQKLANAQRDYVRFKSLYNIELKKEQEAALTNTETTEENLTNDTSKENTSTNKTSGNNNNSSTSNPKPGLNRNFSYSNLN